MMRRTQADNVLVIDAMLHEGLDVPDTVADLVYVPHRHVKDPATGEPWIRVVGMRAMFESGEFSCADAAAYESAVQERKYGVPSESVSVPVGADDYHGIYVTAERAVDPTANWQRGVQANPGLNRGRGQARGCRIEDERVICEIDAVTGCVDPKRQIWRGGPRAGRAEPLTSTWQNAKGQAWGRTKDGVLVPLCGRSAR